MTNQKLAVLFETIIILWVIYFWIFKFIKLIFPAKNKYTSGNLYTFVANPVKQLNLCFLGALILWATFYFFLFLSSGNELLSNTLQNFTTLCLLRIYVILSAPNIGTGRGKQHASIFFWGYVLILLAAFFLDILVHYQAQLYLFPANLRTSLSYFSGIAQGLAIFMIMGRLEDAMIRDHLKLKTFVANLLFNFLFFCGYVYAALQPFYPYFSKANSGEFILVLIGIAFFLKMSLIRLFFMLNRHQGSKPSAFENYIYEMERFNVEELKSYERSFLRKHVNPFYRREQLDKGYLGIEYLKLNKFKRVKLGIPEDCEGLWITDVYPGSSAMENGLQAGDYITKVKHQPIGFHNSLSVLLEDSKPNECVRVAFLRLNRNLNSDDYGQCLQLNCTVDLKQYSELMSHTTFRLSKPWLDITVLYNNRDQGVVVIYKEEPEPRTLIGIEVIDSEEYYKIPDVQMLKLTLGLLTPGDNLKLHFIEKIEDTCRFGPGEKSTTVNWHSELGDKNKIENKIKILKPSLLEFHKENIIKAYNSIFSEIGFNSYEGKANEEERDIIKQTMSDFTNGYFYVFDSSFNKLFEYRFYDKDRENWVSWPIWNKVETGIIYILVGRDFKKIKDKFGLNTNLCTSGTFFCCSLSRIQTLEERE